MTERATVHVQYLHYMQHWAVYQVTMAVSVGTFVSATIHNNIRHPLIRILQNSHRSPECVFQFSAQSPGKILSFISTMAIEPLFFPKWAV